MLKNKSVEFVYNTLTLEQKKEIIELWINEGVLSLENAKQRINQVCGIIKNESNQIIGLNSIYIQDFTIPDNPYFFMRVFIQQKYRGDYSIRHTLYKLLFFQLRDLYSEHGQGLVIELENQKLLKKGYTRYISRMGWTYYGKSPRGLPLWYVRFDDPKGIFLDS